jgi:hypothetical protein
MNLKPVVEFLKYRNMFSAPIALLNFGLGNLVVLALEYCE